MVLLANDMDIHRAHRGVLEQLEEAYITCSNTVVADELSPPSVERAGFGLLVGVELHVPAPAMPVEAHGLVLVWKPFPSILSAERLVTIQRKKR